MTSHSRMGQRLALGALLLAVMALASACYQPAGDTLEATSVASIATFTPVPSMTPIGPPTATPIQLIAFTNTPDSASQSQQVVTDPFSATATAQALGIGVSQPADLPLGTPADPFSQTATAMSRGVILPTDDPFAVTGDPLALTATAIVSGATQTAAAPMTQTAGALFPSLTPLATQPPFFTPVPTLPPGGSCTHTVAAGENLFRISLRYNTTVDAIAAANGIVNPQLILVGQQLVIPNCGSSGSSTTSSTTPPPAGGLQPGEQMHVVRQGETLMSISLTYNVPVNSIAARNSLSNPNLIFINQELIIPVA